MTSKSVNYDAINKAITNMLSELDISKEAFDGLLISEMVYTCVRLYQEDHGIAQLKLINRSLERCGMLTASLISMQQIKN